MGRESGEREEKEEEGSLPKLQSLNLPMHLMALISLATGLRSSGRHLHGMIKIYAIKFVMRFWASVCVALATALLPKSNHSIRRLADKSYE